MGVYGDIGDIWGCIGVYGGIGGIWGYRGGIGVYRSIGYMGI